MRKTAYPASSKKELTAGQAFFSHQILNQSFLIEISSGEYIQRETEPLHYLYYLLVGKAKILKNQSNGKRSILQFLKAGDFVGDLTLIQAEKTTKDVISIGETICLAVPINVAKSVLMNDLSFVKKLGQYIGEKLLVRMDHFTINQTFELKYRLADLLLTAAVDNVYQEKHTEIAEYLGVSYRHLLYTFKQFRKLGLIKKQTNGYLINRDKLEQFMRQQKG